MDKNIETPDHYTYRDLMTSHSKHIDINMELVPPLLLKINLKKTS